MKKNIGILTFHYPENRNFGAALQSFAVIKLYEKLGLDAQIINFIPGKISYKGKILYLIEGQNFKKYCDKFLKISKIKFKDKEELNKKFDIFSVGSDQVWRPIWWRNQVKHYFLDFVNENKKKIAYAASFGVDFWEGDKELEEEIKILIKKFNYVSVREESGIKICKDIFFLENVSWVLDPTLMIDKQEYDYILEDWKDKTHKNRRYIAYMLLDETEEARKVSKKISEYLKSDIIYIKGKKFKIFGKVITKYNKVSQWLNYLKNAELVITDSFHCAIFSIIFHKKFIVISNRKRGVARLETLLKKFKLENRFFTNLQEILKSGILDREIDYEKVDQLLEKYKKLSLDFLKKALED